jgi:hypothetical protein
MTFEQSLPSLEREQNAKFIDRIVVKPVGRGRKVPVSERVEVYWTGSDTPYDLTTFNLPPPTCPQRWWHERHRPAIHARRGVPLVPELFLRVTRPGPVLRTC